MRSRWPADAAPPAFGAIAEGAWIAVAVAAVVAPIGGPGPLGSLLPPVAAAVLGALVARLWPFGQARAVALLVVAVAVVAASLLGGRPLGLAAAEGPAPVGLYVLLGLAVLRGAAQGDPSAGSHAIDTLVRRSPVLLGGGWILGLVMAGEGRPAFTVAAATATLVFVIAAAIGLGTARLAALPPDTREQLRGNDAWLLMVLVVVGCSLAVALPAAAALGGPIGLLAGGISAVATTAILGFAGGVMSAVVVVVDLFAGLFRGLFDGATIVPSQPPPEPLPDRPVMPGGSQASDSVLEPIIGIMVIAALLGIAWYLARRWRGARLRPGGPSVPEHRSFHLDARGALPSVRLPSRLRAMLAPHDALEAYPRLLDDWSDTPALARDAAETPAAHAARLRSSGLGAPALDLLAADYQLARFGGVTLTPAEHRRAVRRWRRLRRHRPTG